MCGITGWIDFEKNLTSKSSIIRKMTDTLSRRGPDDSGYFMSKNVLLGHRRLAVVDPRGGAQPMTRTIGTQSYTIIYNGELYNTDEVRNELIENGFKFQSYSDTEVLLIAYIFWGSECLHHINGIFAFGIWDEHKQQVFLARDPLGVKPLFYYINDNSIIFGSEIKALLANPNIVPEIDELGLTQLFSVGPARPLGSAILKDIHDLPPANYLIFSKDNLVTKEYWKLTYSPSTEDFSTAVEHTQSLLVDAVKRQLVADVPVCTFLSGGLDSSAISAIAAESFRANGKKLHTYSIDYEDNDKYFKADFFQPTSDNYWALKMSETIESSHHPVVISNKDLASALFEAVLANDLPGMADVDSSLLLFSKEVRKNAVVALSGECAIPLRY